MSSALVQWMETKSSFYKVLKELKELRYPEAEQIIHASCQRKMLILFRSGKNKEQMIY